MRPSSRASPSSAIAGFTLIEVIVSIIVTAILAGMIALFVRWPVQAYVDATSRGKLADAADTALRRIGRDIRQALPNSVRITSGTCTAGSGTCYFIEFIPIKAGGRYRVAPGSSGGNALDLEATGNQTFDVLGPSVCQASAAECTVASGDSLVLYNQGSGNSNAYLNPATTPKANRRIVSSSGNDLTSLSFTGSGQGLCKSLPAPYYDSSTDTCNPDDGSTSPHYYELTGFRFYLVGSAATYECPSSSNPAMTTIRRHSGYGLAATQPTSFSGAGIVSATLATQVDNCSAKLSTDSRLLIIGLNLTANGETIHLLHQIDLYNAP